MFKCVHRILDLWWFEFMARMHLLNSFSLILSAYKTPRNKQIIMKSERWLPMAQILVYTSWMTNWLKSNLWNLHEPSVAIICKTILIVIIICDEHRIVLFFNINVLLQFTLKDNCYLEANNRNVGTARNSTSIRRKNHKPKINAKWTRMTQCDATHTIHNNNMNKINRTWIVVCN